MRWDVGLSRPVREVPLKKQVLEFIVREPAVVPELLLLVHIPPFLLCTVTRIALVSLSHCVCARVSTSRCALKLCILSMKLSTFGQRPYFYRKKNSFTGELCFTKTGITSIHNELVLSDENLHAIRSHHQHRWFLSAYALEF